MKENNTYHEGTGANNLPESLRVNPFDVPKDYFNNLESSILSQVKLVSLKDEEVFETPVQYFDSLSTSIIGRIAEENLKEEVQSEGFKVPTDYFDHLEEAIFSRIGEGQMKESVISDGFEVPDQYFATLSDKILSSTNPSRQQVAVRSLRKPTLRFMRYVAAACVIMLSGLGGYLGFSHLKTSKEQANNVAELHLSQVPEEEIINYLAASTTGDDMVYLAKYTNENDIPTNGIANSISEKEIEDYLNYSL